MHALNYVQCYKSSEIILNLVIRFTPKKVLYMVGIVRFSKE